MSNNQTNAAAPMRLRAEAPRVTRLSRKVLAGVTAVALVGIGGALIYALQTSDTGKKGEELYSTGNRLPADGLAGLPKDYTGPILGPALPGDLGRPILDAQNKGQPVVPPTIVMPTVDEAEQRRRAEEEAARTSTVFFQSRAGSTATTKTATTPGLPGLDLASQSGQQTAQDKQLAFFNAAADRRTVTPDRVTPPASPFVLQAGAVIPAALITGIRSDLPGQITAQVTETIYDSPTGRILIIPQGTRLIGQYDNNVQFGQRRALLVWNRLIFPNGRSIVLERLPGADSQGYAGLEDGVDYHWWDLAKAAALSTLLGVGAELATDDNDRLIAAIQDGTQDTINQAGQQTIQRQLQIAPTLTIRPGFPVRVIVTRDLVLEPYRG
ncbi:TrbI/VirB10 family protein [Agrobacterium tumefaciens]|uniref:TrbI/VirB10 family protein n=1 Tax=Agrobacterium tumefaciens TaxID=358 RepID=UPI0015743465|nr:TrbI/VirB10 family protein [Agrobacterium tumefaciens]UXT20444.1 TrbI/VirB10 family protein [Agrobacterium tumefaciens]WHO20764.1 TrbI/VirB10 family protein [Agrobacterium tumefaciens]WHO23549.1 TrbI/VirB10 family protein [Agrobacterium tumefaciens]